MGSPQVINCTVSTVSGVESSLILISWVGPRGSSGGSGSGRSSGSGGGSGGVSILSDSRVTISPTASSGSNNYTSSLRFTYLMEGDEGTYTCDVMILESSGTNSVEIDALSSKCIVN